MDILDLIYLTKYTNVTSIDMDIKKINELNHATTIEGLDQLVFESNESGELKKINLSTIESDITDLIPNDGVNGEKGLPGAKGNTGRKGDVGHKGDTGDLGDKGFLGEKGVKGNLGNEGDIGDLGDIGQKGERGEKGNSGTKGVRGVRGNRGATGIPATDGEKGFRGIQGNLGHIGDTGQKGDTGDSYEKNNPLLLLKRGPKGDRGDMATGGIAGDEGDLGETGSTGIQGRVGKRGLPAKRENKVDYPVYGAKLVRDWELIYDVEMDENSSGLDYIEKKVFLTNDFAKLKYKFIKILFKVNPNYIPTNIVDLNAVRTCILMIPGKITKWSPVVFGSPSILWYKSIGDNTNSVVTRTHNRQGVQIFVDTDNFSSSESEIPNQRIQLVANKPSDSFDLVPGVENKKFKIIGVYGTNDI
jgi:hypothetical protein